MPKNLELSYLMDFYGDMLTEKQRDVMEQYYNDDLSLAEIAENFGITRQGVRDSIKRGEGILLDLEQKVGFLQKTRSMQSGLQKLEELAGSIVYCTKSRLNHGEEIAKQANEMLAVIQTLNE